MNDATLSRKQQLWTLESEIIAAIARRYEAGMKLKQIRDEQLYKEDRFKTWDEYCRKQLSLCEPECNKLIAESERFYAIEKAMDEMTARLASPMF
jgi:hypothetical protein